VELKALRLANKERLLISYLNINSIRNKLTEVKNSSKCTDILCISETKIDQSFTTSQFLLNDFKKPYRKDVSNSSGGLLVYVRSHITAKELKCPNLPNDIECIALELNVKSAKWLIPNVYRNPTTQSLTYFLD